MPHRVQLRRTKGWRKPEGVLVVSRPSRFGNPFKVGEVAPDGAPIRTRADAVAMFREWLTGPLTPDTPWPERYAEMHDRMGEIEGHDLACWCPMDGPCHVDVLLEIANGRVEDAHVDPHRGST